MNNNFSKYNIKIRYGLPSEYVEYIHSLNKKLN